MSRKKIEYFIPLALEEIKGQFKKSNGEIPKVYNGYIASMGAGLSQSGLLPTLAIFSSHSESQEGDKRKLMRILTNMLSTYAKEKKVSFYEGLRALTDEEKKKDTETRLLHFVASFQSSPTQNIDPEKHRRVRQDLLDASVAVKLAIRTYKLV